MGYRYGGTSSTSSAPPACDRIRDAAIELFGEHGFAEISLKTIAEQAGVSPPLVIHHFGSKSGLRQTCDRHVADQFRRAKTEAVNREGDMPQDYLFQVMQENSPLVLYMFRAFTAGGPEMDRLMDQLVEDSLKYTAKAEELGQVRPSRNPHSRAVLMLLMSFGSMMLHHQMKRLIGVSPIDDPPERWGPYIAAVSEIYLHGALRPEAYPDLVAFVESFPGVDTSPNPENSAEPPPP